MEIKLNLENQRDIEQTSSAHRVARAALKKNLHVLEDALDHEENLRRVYECFPKLKDNAR